MRAALAPAIASFGPLTLTRNPLVVTLGSRRLELDSTSTAIVEPFDQTRLADDTRPSGIRDGGLAVALAASRDEGLIVVRSERSTLAWSVPRGQGASATAFARAVLKEVSELLVNGPAAQATQPARQEVPGTHRAHT